MFIYSQSQHKLYHNDTILSSDGYSGHDLGMNNPSMQSVAMIGPLPVGLYDIGNSYNHPKLGPITMDLTPDPHNEMFGRSLFRIHPDSIEHPHEASEGCMCQNKDVRTYISNSSDKKLIVIP